MTVLPGLMDAHVHLTGNTDLKGNEGISESSYLATIYGVKNAKNFNGGFTTEKCWCFKLFRCGIERWYRTKSNCRTYPVSGPPLGITGGHCDSNILPAEYEYKAQGVADGPWEVVERFVRIKNTVLISLNIVQQVVLCQRHKC